MKNALRLFVAASIAATPFLSAPAYAVQKKIGVTSFDTITIHGDFIVTVTETTGSSVEANGDISALEALDIVVDSRRTLVIRERRLDNKPRGATNIRRKPVQLTIRATGLSGVAMLGNGKLQVSGVRKDNAYFTLGGNGAIRVDNIKSRFVTTSLDGAGTIYLAGTTQTLTVNMAGAGSIDTRNLTASDLTVRANGNGVGNFVAGRRAEINAQGMGTIIVTGKAACKVENSGLGDVYCGPDDKAPTNISDEI